jgi:hypothetical protein
VSRCTVQCNTRRDIGSKTYAVLSFPSVPLDMIHDMSRDKLWLLSPEKKCSVRFNRGGHHSALLACKVPTRYFRGRFWKFCDHRGSSFFILYPTFGSSIFFWCHRKSFASFVPPTPKTEKKLRFRRQSISIPRYDSPVVPELPKASSKPPRGHLKCLWV